MAHSAWVPVTCHSPFRLKSCVDTDVDVFVMFIRLLRKPGTEPVQALADISRSALCCHGNETRAPIANPPNSAQLEGTQYHSPNLHPGLCSSVLCGNVARVRHMDVTSIHFASATPHAKCNE